MEVFGITRCSACRPHRAEEEIFVQRKNPRNILALLDITSLALQHIIRSRKDVQVTRNVGKLLFHL